MASASCSWRTSTSGQPSPTMCSFRFARCPLLGKNARASSWQRLRQLERQWPVNASGRACHSGSDHQLAGAVSDSTEHAPDEWTMPFPIRPGVIAVRNESKGEAALLRPARQAHQFGGRELLTRELVTELGQCDCSTWI